MTNLAKALLAFQADAPALQKTALNPHFKSRYVPLDEVMDAVRPILTKHGLVVLQMVTTLTDEAGFHPALCTRIIHAESGESITETMLLLAAKADPQGQGSAITYARRYSLMAALGLVADEDDDGNATHSSARRPTAVGRARDDAREGGGQLSSGTITKTERRGLFVLAKEKGIDRDTMKALVKEFAGVDSSMAIPKAKLASVRSALSNWEAAA